MWCDAAPSVSCTEPTCSGAGLPRRLTMHCVFSVPAGTGMGPNVRLYDCGPLPPEPPRSGAAPLPLVDLHPPAARTKAMKAMRVLMAEANDPFAAATIHTNMTV